MDILHHSNNVFKLCAYMGEELNFDREDFDNLCAAAIFHDIGKNLIPDYILDKTGELNDFEKHYIKSHPVLGADIIDKNGFYHDICNAVMFHHERWDGLGYPLGLKGKDIPILSRIIAICDSFDAMTSNRPYSRRKNESDALNEILMCAGTQFDPYLVKVFLKVFKPTKVLEQICI